MVLEFPSEKMIQRLLTPRSASSKDQASAIGTRCAESNMRAPLLLKPHASRSVHRPVVSISFNRRQRKPLA